MASRVVFAASVTHTKQYIVLVVLWKQRNIMDSYVKWIQLHRCRWPRIVGDSDSDGWIHTEIRTPDRNYSDKRKPGEVHWRLAIATSLGKFSPFFHSFSRKFACTCTLQATGWHFYSVQWTGNAHAMRFSAFFRSADGRWAKTNVSHNTRNCSKHWASMQLCTA